MSGWFFSKRRKDSAACCTAPGQLGQYQLKAREELVVLSYPGPPRGIVVGTPLPHRLPLPTQLLPILTVTNLAGTVDVVVEAFPNEHWFRPPNVPVPNLPPQPRAVVCQQDALLSAKVFPEEGQPGIDRFPPPPQVARVETRPIYFVRLDARQSTTVYAAPPGGWVRLRALDTDARGTYCFSWCCLETAEQTRETGGDSSNGTPPPPPSHDEPPHEESPPPEEPG